jgi:diguanylate cyclase (GGDEF)-like protein
MSNRIGEEMSRQNRMAMRDLVVFWASLGLAILAVLFFDTGLLAHWVARHEDTKVDEVIVAVLVLSVGLCIFSARRWRELTHQVSRYEELHAEMTRLNREASLLAEFGELLQSCLSPAEAHKMIVEHSQTLFPGFSGAVGIIANSRDLVEVVALWGEPLLKGRSFPPGDCWALRRGRMHSLRAESQMSICTHIGADRPEYAVCVPMMAQGEALGILYLDNGRSVGTSTMNQLPDSQLRLAKTFAEHIALALANLNLREVLRLQSIRDPLTGLFNRRYMEESLDRELRRAIRNQTSLGVMMMDVDHFKRFNDAFGHEAGDAVLRELARVLKAQFRAEDIACRYGGEEFAMILPEATLEETQQRAEKLRELASRTVAQYRGRPLDRITLSIGLSCYPEHGLASEALLQAADVALYRAKEEGRNRVVVV